MMMLERRKRAAFGDRANWSAATHKDYVRRLTAYRAATSREAIDEQKPPVEWLSAHLLETRMKNGRGYTRKYARVIGHFLREHGSEDILEHRQVRTVLDAPDDVDPLSIDLADEDVVFARGRATMFSDDGYASGTYASYNYIAKKWKTHADGLGVDWQQPPSSAFEDYLEIQAGVYSARTVRNVRNALAHLFRKNGGSDAVARSAMVERILDGVERKKQVVRSKPMAASERRSIVAGLEDEGAGIRDRCIVLITAFTALTCEDLALLDVEDCVIEADGVTLRLPRAETVHIGCHPERVLDLKPWLEQYLANFHGEGPLFRRLLQRRMRYDTERMTPVGIHTTIRKAAENAGVSRADLAGRLRRLFESEVLANESVVVEAHAKNRRRAPDHQGARHRAEQLMTKAQRQNAAAALR